MPRCLGCGNNTFFGSTEIPTSSPWSGSYGLVASFDPQGNIVNWENNGAANDVLQKAWEKPNIHFDSCINCGSTNLIWP